MSTSTLSIERRPDGVFSSVEQQALVGFLGGYSDLTRDAYALDLRQFAAWCQQQPRLRVVLKSGCPKVPEPAWSQRVNAACPESGISRCPRQP